MLANAFWHAQTGLTENRKRYGEKLGFILSSSLVV
jgi:hypothetical protein